MWYKNYKKIDDIVVNTGSEINPKFEIDFDKLAEITNHYGKFLEKVKANYEEENVYFKNIVVYACEGLITSGPRKGENCVKIFVAFDHYDTYISLFGCDTNHKKDPFIFEFEQNKTFVSMMANLL